MPGSDECAAILALMREGPLSEDACCALRAEPASAYRLLEEAHGLLAEDAAGRAAGQIESWCAEGIEVLCPVDPGYPENLRSAHDRPLLIFIAGRLLALDERSVAIIGSRRASDPGLQTARAIAGHLVEAGFTVVSGLAAGIDTAAHTAALAHGGRTVAVIGTGHGRCYPPENQTLQQRIARHGAVVSRFWPGSPPTRESFRLRNAVMSGLSMASVVVEATRASGARLQARLALAQGRTVVLLESLLDQEWARELAEQEGVQVVGSPSRVPDVVEPLRTGTQFA